MAKVAKLVRVSLVTRVIVDEDATEQDIMELAVPKLSEDMMDNPFQIIDEIIDDVECPYSEGEQIGLTQSEVNVLNTAKWILCTSNDEELIEMIKLIIDHENKGELIDNIDGVDTWIQVENTYSVESFLENICYTGVEFKD